jgi:hypothetical protein
MWPLKRSCFWCAIIFMCIGPVACQSKKQSSESERKGLANYQGIENPFVLFQKYCDLEQKQEYADIYGLLSQKRKKYLERFNVKNAEQYRDLRESSEAIWNEFSVDQKSMDNGSKVTVTGQAVVEESGEKEKVAYKCILIKEGHTWKIDDWTYQSAKGTSDLGPRQVNVIARDRLN